MAKGNLILGTAVGKLGDAVLFRQDGQQRSRVRVRIIKNPKTQSQAVNRALLNTLSSAYTYMKGIVDHSFQGLSKPVENQRKFAKLNQGIARATGSVAVPGTDSGYNFNFKGETLLRPNPYAISRGTMPGVEVFNIASEGQMLEGFRLNTELSALLNPTTTYKQFCDAIGVEVGAQLTFCIINDDTFTGVPSETNMPKSYGNFHYARIILSDDAGNGDVPMFVSDQGDMTINPAYANSRNAGSLLFDRIGEDTLQIIVNGYAYPLAMGIIVSNYSSRMWLRSNCDMVVAEGYQDSNTMSEVYASYMLQEETPLSNLYLNQGEGTITSPSEDIQVTFGAMILQADSIEDVQGISAASSTETYTQDDDKHLAFVLPMPIRSLSNNGITMGSNRLCNTPRQSADFLTDQGFSEASAYEAVTVAREGRQYVYILQAHQDLQAAPCVITLANGLTITITAA